MVMKYNFVYFNTSSHRAFDSISCLDVENSTILIKFVLLKLVACKHILPKFSRLTVREQAFKKQKRKQEQTNHQTCIKRFGLTKTTSSRENAFNAYAIF